MHVCFEKSIKTACGSGQTQIYIHWKAAQSVEYKWDQQFTIMILVLSKFK